MRIEIKTSSPVKDKDIKGLYVLNAGMQMTSARMREVSLKFIADKYGFKISPK
jgi:hypothetical protein